jgi:quinol monooxygenase YgiN
MTVLVTMRGKVSDWGSFKGALDWYAGLPRPAGLHWSRTYRREGDEDYIVMMEEWDDHDSYHKSTDTLGEEFTERTKQKSWDGWETEVWTHSGAPHVESDGTRSVVVWMTVTPRDWNAFKDTIAWAVGEMSKDRPKGLHSTQVYRNEKDPNLVLDLEEWDSHDIWMQFADQVGEEFNKRANTEGLDWETFIWHPSDAKVIA